MKYIFGLSIPRVSVFVSFQEFPPSYSVIITLKYKILSMTAIANFYYGTTRPSHYPLGFLPGLTFSGAPVHTKHSYAAHCALHLVWQKMSTNDFLTDRHKHVAVSLT